MRFLIADDHEMFLNGLEFILTKEYKDIELVSAHSYTDIFKIIEKDKNFDLIITDLAMPGDNWNSAIKKIHNTCLEVPIVVISAVFDKEILRETFEMGVSGYISKSFSNSIILSAINLVLAGGAYVPVELLQNNIQEIPELGLLNNKIKSQKDDKEASPCLTSRQIDVLKCMAKGLANKQIAYELGVREGTVKIHITLLMKALGVTNRLAAVQEATARKII